MGSVVIVSFVISAILVIISIPAVRKGWHETSSGVNNGDLVALKASLKWEIDTWQSRYVPAVAGILAGAIVWTVHDGVPAWGILVYPLIYSTATSFVSYAFLRQRVPQRIEAIGYAAVVAALSVVACLASAT